MRGNVVAPSVSQMRCRVIEQIRASLLAALATIEDAANYYAMFGRTVELCAVANERNRLLFDAGGISDEEFCSNNQRIEEARKKMIISHGDWTKQFLEQRKDRHTVGTLVSSVYNDIFGIEIH